jgi:hypothetical protein
MAKFGSIWCNIEEDELDPVKNYIVLNDQAEVFSGLKGGYPVFSLEFEEAKPLGRKAQFRTLESMVNFPIFKEYI